MCRRLTFVGVGLSQKGDDFRFRFADQPDAMPKVGQHPASRIGIGIRRFPGIGIEGQWRTDHLRRGSKPVAGAGKSEQPQRDNEGCWRLLPGALPVRVILKHDQSDRAISSFMISLEPP